jgi:protein phosphatase
MGTTLTAAYLDDSNLTIAHVGDSRAYLFRNGSLRRLTQDHSLVDELVRRGKLTEEQAAEHPQRSIITRALGPEPDVEVDTWTYPVRPDDVLMLCSDGLTSMVSEERVGEILASSDNLNAAAQALIDEANAAGGRDNITVVLFRVEEVEGAKDGAVDQPTLVGAPAVAQAEPPVRQLGSARVPPGGHPLRRESSAAAAGTTAGAVRERPPRRTLLRRHKAVAVLIAVVIVLALIITGGYLATRNVYFIGTNANGIVTIYRGLPYDLPAGIHLYETFYVSGVPASLVPPDRRSVLFNNNLRSESDAAGVVRALELGQLTK